MLWFLSHTFNLSLKKYMGKIHKIIQMEVMIFYCQTFACDLFPRVLILCTCHMSCLLCEKRVCTPVHIYVSKIVQTDVYKEVLCVVKISTFSISMLSRCEQFCPRCEAVEFAVEEVQGCGPKNQYDCVHTESWLIQVYKVHLWIVSVKQGGKRNTISTVFGLTCLGIKPTTCQSQDGLLNTKPLSLNQLQGFKVQVKVTSKRPKKLNPTFDPSYSSSGGSGQQQQQSAAVSAVLAQESLGDPSDPSTPSPILNTEGQAGGQWGSEHLRLDYGVFDHPTSARRDNAGVLENRWNKRESSSLGND